MSAGHGFGSRGDPNLPMVRGKAARGPSARTPLSNLSPTRGERLFGRLGPSRRGPGLRGPRKVILCGVPLRRGDALGRAS